MDLVFTLGSGNNSTPVGYVLILLFSGLWMLTFETGQTTEGRRERQPALGLQIRLKYGRDGREGPNTHMVFEL